MNGAQALVRTLVGHGVDTCFMNPGTSEMHFVSALDSSEGLRGILALFEGVATGAADGYGRMTGRPAATLLHLGPGLGNGLANLHNARKGRTPVVNIVGDHAVYHKKFDAQLESDIDTVARNVSTFIRRSSTAATVATDAVDAILASLGPPGQVATLILPADASWSEGAEPVPGSALPGTARGEAPDPDAVATVARVLRSGEPAAILAGGRALHGPALDGVGRVAVATGVKLLAETFPARLERGAGRPPVERLAYLSEFSSMQLAGLRHLVLVDAAPPVSFFAYPGKLSDLVPEGCTVHHLVDPSGDAPAAVAALVAELGCEAVEPVRQAAARPGRPTGALTAETVCAALGALLPEGAVVSDEGNTAGLFAGGATAGAPPHDWLSLTGGAIGQGLPLAVGAAVACPGRRVVAFEADGSALYTPQAWWTMAREGLDVTSIILNNHSYAVLNMELQRVGAEPPGPRAKSMLDLSRPDLDFTSLARAMGLDATRATTAEEFTDALDRSLSTQGPSVVEAVIPPVI